MKGWLRTLGLTALLASTVLANEVELVRSHALALFFFFWVVGYSQSCRNQMKRTANDARECTAARLGEETSTPLYW